MIDMVERIGQGSTGCKAGQGSTEYLVILGVALIVALVVVGLLGYFPGISGDMQISESKTYWSTSQPFAISDAKQSSDDNTLQLVVVNSAGIYLEISNFTVSALGANYSNATRLYFLPGDRNVANFRSPPFNCTGGNAGRTASYGITITYDQDQLAGKRQAGSKPLLVKCS